MPIELKMPALSPTMEEGTLAKWLVKEGDEVKSGDILAEIETDKATMEFEAVDEGKIAKILVPEGTDGVKVGAPIAIMAGEGEDASTRQRRAQGRETPPPAPPKAAPEPKADATPKAAPPAASAGRNARPPAAARRGLARGREATASRPRPSRAGSRRHRTSICRASRAAAPAAASSAPTSTPRPARRLPPRRAAAPPLRHQPATLSCPAPSSRRSRTRRSSSRTSARPSRAA